MANLNVTVINSIGNFSGKIVLASNTDTDGAYNVMKEIIGSINTMKHLAIEHDDGSATVFGEAVLKSSIVTVSVAE
jgi:hypothetical protein